jgi:hypothetical protein
MVTVYNFKLWDAGCGVWVYPVFKTTSDRIEEARGKIIVGTHEKIDPSMLSARGHYLAVQAKMGRQNRNGDKNGQNVAQAA